jgi:hypothetical protein
LLQGERLAQVQLAQGPLGLLGRVRPELLGLVRQELLARGRPEQLARVQLGLEGQVHPVLAVPVRLLSFH